MFLRAFAVDVTEKREAWIARRSSLDLRRLVFVDESGANMVLLPALEALLSSISIGPLDLGGLTLTPLWVGADGPMGDFLSVYMGVESDGK